MVTVQHKAWNPSLLNMGWWCLWHKSQDPLLFVSMVDLWKQVLYLMNFVLVLFNILQGCDSVSVKGNWFEWNKAIKLAFFFFVCVCVCVCVIYSSVGRSLLITFFVCVIYFSVPTKGWLNLLLPLLVISGVLSLCLASVVFLLVVLFWVVRVTFV